MRTRRLVEGETLHSALTSFAFSNRCGNWSTGTLFHLQQVVRALLVVLVQRISVGRLAAERFEDHHFQGSGKEIARYIFLVLHKALIKHA